MSGDESQLLIINRSRRQDALIADLIQHKYIIDWSLATVAERDRRLETFRCPVCNSDPVKPHICPECDKYFCHRCLKEAYERDGKSCPHCR